VEGKPAYDTAAASAPLADQRLEGKILAAVRLKRLVVKLQREVPGIYIIPGGESTQRSHMAVKQLHFLRGRLPVLGKYDVHIAHGGILSFLLTKSTANPCCTKANSMLFWHKAFSDQGVIR
jgi:hypothetical protein